MATYHALYSGLWNDDALEGLTFETKGFFAYLCTNDRVRPSGIYRVSDDQLVADTGLPLKRVRSYLSTLVSRGRLIRDGWWLFIQGYLKRQPKHDRLLAAVRQDVENCSSRVVLEAFSLKYTQFSRWSADRLLTVTRPSAENGRPSAENGAQKRWDIEEKRGPSPDGQPPDGLIAKESTQAQPSAGTQWVVEEAERIGRRIFGPATVTNLPQAGRP